jgi:hypothetical protein
LALIAKHRGDITAATRLAKQAKLSFPAKWLLERIEAEFGSVK